MPAISLHLPRRAEPRLGNAKPAVEALVRALQVRQAANLPNPIEALRARLQ